MKKFCSLFYFPCISTALKIPLQMLLKQEASITRNLASVCFWKNGTSHCKTFKIGAIKHLCAVSVPAYKKSIPDIYVCWGKGSMYHMNSTKKLSLLVHITCKLCVHAKLLQLCLTLCNPMDWSLPDFCVHRILQARILEWGVISSTRGSSWPRNWTHVTCGSCTAGR